MNTVPESSGFLAFLRLVGVAYYMSVKLQPAYTCHTITLMPIHHVSNIFSGFLEFEQRYGSELRWRLAAPIYSNTSITLVENTVGSSILEPGMPVPDVTTTTSMVWMKITKWCSICWMGLRRKRRTSPPKGIIPNTRMQLQDWMFNTSLQVCQSWAAIWVWLFLKGNWLP